MEPSLVRLLACLFALLMGSIGVLCSMQIMVVPRHDDFAQSWRRTKCYIKNISFSAKEDNYRSLMTSISRHDVDRSQTVNNTRYSSLCVHVFVDYVSRDNSLRETYLQEKKLAFEEDECPQSKHCFCCGCSKHRHGSHSTSLTFRNRDFRISTIRVGDPVDCYQGNWTKVAMATRSGIGPSAWKSLRIILWPTLIFVVGFVGSFFSFIDWFEESQWRRNHPISYDVRMENISRETTL